MKPRAQHGKESGFALLVIFLMAAIIAITLYKEIPRVAFDSQRQKELMLVDRGEQYKRAIQLFVHKNSRYPAKLEELESMNNVRYLRHRYKDPITGKDEWRLIHVGPGGVFTDSLVNKPKDGKEKSTYANNFIAEGPAIGGSVPTTGNQTNAATRRRASEGGAAGGTVLGPDGQPVVTQPGSTTPGSGPPDGVPPGGGTPTGTLGGTPGLPGGLPGVPGQPASPGAPGTASTPGTVPPGIPGSPGIPAIPGVPVTPGQPGQPGTGTGTGIGGNTGNSGSSGGYIGSSQPYIGGSGSYIGSGSGSTSTGGAPLPGLPGQPVNSQTGGVSPYPTTPGSQGAGGNYPQPGVNMQNDATRLIQQILTQPRASQGYSPNAGMAGLNIGPGIAGVASTAEDEGILVYNDRTKYNEWEFIYDPTKEKRVVNPNAGGTGTAADKMNNQNTNTNTNTNTNNNSGSNNSLFSKP